MILVNIDRIPGKELDAIGIAKGSAVRTKNVFRDIGASLKSLVGGEIQSYLKMMEEARQIATKRMVDEAERMGADAVVGVRYSTSAIMAGASEMLVYGTAVKFRE